MTRNPHEIVTLDDQPEGERYDDGEGYELGRAYGTPKPVDYVSPFCNDCKHPESWHAEGIGPCEYPGSNRTEGCGCEAFDRVKFPQETHCAACEDAAKWPGGWDASIPTHPNIFCACGHTHVRFPSGEFSTTCDAAGCLCVKYRPQAARTGTSKPMRIRYMELPGEINPNTNELTTPFVIVIDRVTGGPLNVEIAHAIALNTGARGVLAFEQEIQIGDDPE